MALYLREANVGRTMSHDRTVGQQLAPADPAGVVAILSVLIAPDGKSYAYSYTRLAEDRYLADGLKYRPPAPLSVGPT
jgi:hypothetical protein